MGAVVGTWEELVRERLELDQLGVDHNALHAGSAYLVDRVVRISDWSAAGHPCAEVSMA